MALVVCVDLEVQLLRVFFRVHGLTLPGFVYDELLAERVDLDFLDFVVFVFYVGFALVVYENRDLVFQLFYCFRRN